MSEDSPIQPENDDESDSLSLSQMFGSALAAALGIQSKANRERDFARGKPFHFVIVGLVFTAGFVMLMSLAVQLILTLVDTP